jgi:hypothetical protein
MNSIYSILFLILLSSIHSFDVTKCGATSSPDINLDFSSPYYKSDITFDWTSDDDVDLNIPFIRLSDGAEDFAPFFANATFVKFSPTALNAEYAEGVELDAVGVDNFFVNKDVKFQGYKFAKEITNYKVVDNILKTNVKAKEFKANENSVTEVYKYNFGWLECSGAGEARIRYSPIMISVNNGKFYEISKYLLIFMAALLF